jgi:hypothetical protein
MAFPKPLRALVLVISFFIFFLILRSFRSTPISLPNGSPGHRGDVKQGADIPDPNLEGMFGDITAQTII